MKSDLYNRFELQYAMGHSFCDTLYIVIYIWRSTIYQMSGFQPCLIIQQKVYLQQLTDHANALFNLKQYLSLVLKVHGGIAEDFAVCKRNFFFTVRVTERNFRFSMVYNFRS